MERQDMQVSFKERSFPVSLEPYSIETFKLQTDAAPSASESIFMQDEKAPVYVKFWEHNEGAAPLGYLPVNVRIEAPQNIDTDASRKNIREIKVFVSNDLTDTDVQGEVTIETPPGVRAVPSTFKYDVAANSESVYPVTIILEGQVTPGFIRATIDHDGMKLFDVLEFRLPPKKFGHADKSKEGTRIKWNVVYTDGYVDVELSNPFSQTIDGNVTLAGPVETWGSCYVNPIRLISVEPWMQPFSLEAGETKMLRFKVEHLQDKVDNSFWLVAKLSYFGYLEYKPAVGDIGIRK
jgi:hypothetical protein